MEVKALKAAVLTNNIPKFLIFIEDEQELAKQYITTISNTVSRPLKYYDCIDDVLYDIGNNFKEDVIYVVMNDQKVFKNDRYIEELIKTDKRIILRYDSFDKKSEAYKNYKAYCVTFPKLDNYTILKYLTKKCEENGVAIEQEKLLTLIDNCNCDLGECLNEMDKIFTLEQANSNVLMDYMLNNGFSDYRQVNMFSLINKIINKDQKAFKDRLKSNDSPMSILMNLYSTAKKRLSETKNNEYAKYMTMCKDLCFGIIDGSVNDRSALSYLMLKLM